MGKIRFVKEVVFKDCEGTILKVFKVGDEYEFTAKVGDNFSGGGYYVTGMGGIYFDEAEEVIE